MAATSETIRAVLYARVSTATQADHGTSLDEQRRVLLEHAELQGFEVVELIQDAGESASTLDRPGLTRALAMIERGEADVLVATKTDRVARNLRDLLNLAHALDERGAAIVLADDEFETATAQGRLHAQLMGAFSEWERSLIAERLRAGRAAARERGVRFGRPPVGLTSKRGKVVVKDAERVALAHRVERLRSEGLTLQRIADTLNAEGVATGGTIAGARWHPSSVSRLLRAATVIAAAEPHDE